MRLGRKLGTKAAEVNAHVRKLQRTGEGGKSYSVTLPRQLIAELGWQKKQKVVVLREGRHLVVKDWK